MSKSLYEALSDANQLEFVACGWCKKTNGIMYNFDTSVVCDHCLKNEEAENHDDHPSLTLTERNQ